ncbi:N-acetylglucosamine kinase [Actinokineospora soli]|uniref:N-acetylglucosamine kinase n=1 Tax=Actinokineospora soli TaxID=1048753 RepID=A0ABW2THR5_9PSEU
MDLAVGIDAGGTSTRAIAVSPDGAVVGRGAAGGANPNSNGLAAAASNVAAAVGAALAGRACGCVVLGMAGSSKLLADPAALAEFTSALASVGAPAPVVLSDAEVAFASGAVEADGTVLIAGTGSIAMRIAAHRRAETAGGYGWLLGDEGSAFWLGREAVRAVLDALLRGADLGPFRSAVLAEAGASAFGELITVVNTRPPIDLARFAPLVSAHASEDPAAQDIVERAAQALAALAAQVHHGGPVVIAGSVAAPTRPWEHASAPCSPKRFPPSPDCPTPAPRCCPPPTCARPPTVSSVPPASPPPLPSATASRRPSTQMI